MKHAPTVKPVQLTEEQAKLFDRMQRDSAIAARGRKHDARAREAREHLDAIFGDAVLGMKPDGMLILRTPQTKHYDPLPAKEITYSQFQEIPAWDA